MKSFNSFRSLFIILVFVAITFNTCTVNQMAGTQYCTYATRSNRCDIDKDKNLCFACTGNQCPELVNKQVYLKKGETDTCLVSLGNRISGCGRCAEGDSIVVLSSVVVDE